MSESANRSRGRTAKFDVFDDTESVAVRLFFTTPAMRITPVEWTLRIGACLCFVGHGAFGVLTKEAWVPYFAVVGIGRDMAYRLMPLIGVLDISLGISVLLRPMPIVIVWMLVWTVWTALLRPLAGESFWQVAERAGNYGPPAALLILALPLRARELTRRLTPTPMTSARAARLRLVLSATVILLLVGHGALVLSSNPWIGAIDLALALFVAVAPRPWILVGVALWKLATESIAFAHAPIWEVVERGGDYTAPIALALVIVAATTHIRRSV